MRKILGVLVLLVPAVLSAQQAVVRCGDPCREDPLKIDGAKVALQVDAKRIAFGAFVKKMDGRLSALEGPQTFGIFEIGFNIPDFAVRGDLIWEVRFTELLINSMEPTEIGQLRAIIWVNSKTEAVHFVVGPWDYQLSHP